MNLTITNSMTAKDWSMLLLLSVVWGGSFFFVGLAVKELPPLTIVLIRVGFAAITLWGIVLVCRIPISKSLSNLGLFFIMGLLNNAIPFSLIVWSQTHITSGLASILNATTPLFTVLVAGTLLPDEKISSGKLIGVIVGFAGVVVMIGSTAFEGLGISVISQLAILGAALSYAFAGVFGRRYKALNIHPIMAAAGQVTGSTLLLFPMVLLFDDPFNLPLPTWPTIAAVLSLAVFSTAFAYVLYFNILSSAGATNVSLVTFLIPVSAVLLGTLILDESLSPQHIPGMVIVATGLVLIDGRLWKIMKRKKP